MRICKLETFGDEFVCFVRVTTDTGDTGWGQTSTYNADITATIFHRQVAPWALGADALEIDGLVGRIEDRAQVPGQLSVPCVGGSRHRAVGPTWQAGGKTGGRTAWRQADCAACLCLVHEARHLTRTRGGAVGAAAG